MRVHAVCLLFFLLALVACDVVPDSVGDGIGELGDGVGDVGDGIGELGDGIAKLGTNLEEGLDKVDPLSLKALFAAYQQKEDKVLALEELNRALEQAIEEARSARPYSFLVRVYHNAPGARFKIILDEGTSNEDEIFNDGNPFQGDGNGNDANPHVIANELLGPGRHTLAIYHKPPSGVGAYRGHVRVFPLKPDGTEILAKAPNGDLVPTAVHQRGVSASDSGAGVPDADGYYKLSSYVFQVRAAPPMLAAAGGTS